MWAFGQCCQQTGVVAVCSEGSGDAVVQMGGVPARTSPGVPTEGPFSPDPGSVFTPVIGKVLLNRLEPELTNEADPEFPLPPLSVMMPSPRKSDGLFKTMASDGSLRSVPTDKEPPPAPVVAHELRWLNYVIKKMWPKMRNVVKERVVKELEERMQIQIDQHPQLRQTLQDPTVEFDPGETPPVLKLLRCEHRRSREDDLEGLQMQAEVEWTSGPGFLCKPDLKVKTGIGTKIPSFFALTGVELRGMATAVLTPLTETLPCFGAMQVFFFDPPDCKMMVAGLKEFGLIGKLLANMMKRVLVSIVMDSFVLPHRQLIKVQKSVPLETLVQAKSPLPLGVLIIEVFEAENIIASDTNITGKQASSDPYVEVCVGDGKIRTSTLQKTLSPSWKDGPDFLFVYSLNQLVRVELFDDDVLTEDDQLGWIKGLTVYWLCKDMEGHPQGKWFDITNPSTGQSDAGRLKFHAKFVSLNRLGQRLKCLPQDGTKKVEPSVATANPIPNATSKSSIGSVSSGNHAPAPSNGLSAVGSGDPGSASSQLSSQPHVITVKLLGLEGEYTRHLVGAFCTVEWIPDCGIKKNVNKHRSNTGTFSTDTSKTGETARVSRAFAKARESVMKGWRKAVKTVEHAVENICAGQREAGVKTLQRSGKAMLWSQLLQGHQSGSTLLPPMVVRSIEQLLNREGWDLDRIAQMFGLEVEHVRQAADLRANFEVVWHQSLHFLQLPFMSPFEGGIRLTLHAPKHVERMHGVPDLRALGIMDDQRIIGTVVLKLNHQTVGEDKPYRRRVREVFRRETWHNAEESDPDDQEEDCESLVGEGQAETAGLGHEVPGVLIEFMVEVRSMRSTQVDELLADTEKEDREAALERSRMRGFEIIST